MREKHPTKLEQIKQAKRIKCDGKKLGLPEIIHKRIFFFLSSTFVQHIYNGIGLTKIQFFVQEFMV